MKTQDPGPQNCVLRKNSNMTKVLPKKLLLILPIILVASLLVFYIFQVNALTGLVYQVAEQEYAFDALEENFGSIEQKYLETLSRKNLEDLAELFVFERVSTITYLEVFGPGVAQSR